MLPLEKLSKEDLKDAKDYIEKIEKNSPDNPNDSNSGNGAYFKLDKVGDKIIITKFIPSSKKPGTFMQVVKYCGKNNYEIRRKYGFNRI